MAPDSFPFADPPTVPASDGEVVAPADTRWPAVEEVGRERETIRRHLSFHALLSAMLTGMSSWTAAAVSLVADGSVTDEAFFSEHPCTGGPQSLIDAVVEHFEEPHPLAAETAQPVAPFPGWGGAHWQFECIVHLARAGVCASADGSIRSALDVRSRAYEVAQWAISEVPSFETFAPHVPVPAERVQRFRLAEPLLLELLAAQAMPRPAEAMRLVRALASYRPSGGAGLDGTAYGVGFLRQLPPSRDRALAALEFCRDVVRLEIPEADQLALLRGCIDAMSGGPPQAPSREWPQEPSRHQAHTELMRLRSDATRVAAFSYLLDMER